MIKGNVVKGLYTLGPVTSTELSKFISLDEFSIRVILNRLKKEKLVDIIKKVRTRGRPANLYNLSARGKSLALELLVKEWLEIQGFHVIFEKLLAQNLRIDIFGEKDDKKYGVEIKTDKIDWKFIQYRNFLNFLYLAIPKEKITSSIIKKCKTKGIGVLTISNKSEELLPPKENKIVIVPITVTVKSPIREQSVVSNAIPILKVFKNSLHKPLRLVDIEKRIKLSHQTVFRKIKILETNGILSKIANYYKPNYENSLVYKILELVSAREREEFFNRYPRLKEPLNQLIDFALKNSEIIHITLFGSYATGKTTKTSDIDVFIVIEETKFKQIKESLENLFNQLEGSYLLNKYNFAPVYATPKDVKEMIDERKKFIQSIIEESIIIYGEDNYYRNMVLLLKEWVTWK